MFYTFTFDLPYHNSAIAGLSDAYKRGKKMMKPPLISRVFIHWLVNSECVPITDPMKSRYRHMGYLIIEKLIYVGVSI